MLFGSSAACLQNSLEPFAASKSPTSTVEARRTQFRARLRRRWCWTRAASRNSSRWLPSPRLNTESTWEDLTPDLQITVEKAERPVKVFDAADAKQTVALLASLHHGVLAMSPDVPGLVQNSTNLAIIATKGDVVEIVTSQRSAIESSKSAAARHGRDRMPAGRFRSGA